MEDIICGTFPPRARPESTTSTVILLRIIERARSFGHAISSVQHIELRCIPRMDADYKRTARLATGWPVIHIIRRGCAHVDVRSACSCSSVYDSRSLIIDRRPAYHPPPSSV